MNAKPKPAIDTACEDEEGPFISQALFDDINSDAPSAAAIAWVQRAHARAFADPSPLIPAEDVKAEIGRLLTRLEAERGG